MNETRPERRDAGDESTDVLGKPNEWVFLQSLQRERGLPGAGLGREHLSGDPLTGFYGLRGVVDPGPRRSGTRMRSVHRPSGSPSR